MQVMTKLIVNLCGGKAMSDGYTRSLEPDWGNLTVRDFRGNGGNLTIDFKG
jgi:hypothetical protein